LLSQEGVSCEDYVVYISRVYPLADQLALCALLQKSGFKYYTYTMSSEKSDAAFEEKRSKSEMAFVIPEREKGSLVFSVVVSNAVFKSEVTLSSELEKALALTHKDRCYRIKKLGVTPITLQLQWDSLTQEIRAIEK
jgi:hypothetical protein